MFSCDVATIIIFRSEESLRESEAEVSEAEVTSEAELTSEPEVTSEAEVKSEDKLPSEPGTRDNQELMVRAVLRIKLCT